MGIILVHDIHHISHSSLLGRTRPNRRTNLLPLRWGSLQMTYKLNYENATEKRQAQKEQGRNNIPKEDG